MQELDDNALLREYVEGGAELAFAAIVQRHINKVYSVSLRQTRNPHAAEEITQAVFVILAKKARSLSKSVVLSGWLYETARLTSLTFVRGEIRRARREEEAYMQGLANESAPDAWSQMAPELEAAMGGLNSKDRDAIVLRFFDGKSMREIGAALGLNEMTARQRVNRAVEKLRSIFMKRGVVLPATVLVTALSANSVQAAPAVLASTATAAAITGGATVGSSLSLIKGTLKLMAWTKAKIAVAAGVGVLLVSGTATIALHSLGAPDADDSWRGRNMDTRLLRGAKPQVKILPAKYPDSGGGYGSQEGSWMGIGTGLSSILSVAYDHSQLRMIFPPDFPRQKYDFIAKFPKGVPAQKVNAALQEEIRKTFGYTARLETRETDVLLLQMRAGIAPKLQPPRNPNSGSSRSQSGEFECNNQPVSTLVYYLESYFQKPVINRTGIRGNYDIHLKWNEPDRSRKNPDGLKQVIKDQLGLEFVPARQPIDMLIVEKMP